MKPQLALFPPTSDWVAPTEFPDLSEARVIGFDLETRDPRLLSHGPGWARGEMSVAGISIGVDDGPVSYYPIDHPTGNLDRGKVLSWVREQLSRTSQPKVAHNALYDVGCLRAVGVPVAGPVYDTMHAAALLDEGRRSYSLDAVSQDYLGDRKDERNLREAARYFGTDPKAEMYKLPPMFVGPYAEQDVRLTLALWKRFLPLLHDDNLWDVFTLESDLIPVWIEMRARGVRVNALRAEQLSQEWSKREQKMQKALDREAGIPVNVWANDSVAKAFDRAGVQYPKTPQGTPSFRKGWLENHPSPIAAHITAVRQINKARNTFIESLVFQHLHNGRIHCEFHPLRADGDDENGAMRGTVSGRISSSNPNLQQVPARGEIGAEIRSLFLPEEGELWASCDYSQQEPRILAHFSAALKLGGAKEMVDRFRQDPTTDVYSAVAEAAGIERKAAKVIFLGLSYGMGVKKLAVQLGLDDDSARDLIGQFHQGVPYVRDLMDAVQQRVHARGWVRTILGRRCRFELWEPSRRQEEWSAPLPYADAMKKWGPPVRRAYAYKALNRLVQGSAADQVKAAMRALWQDGIVPTLQVHDELCLSVLSREVAERAKELMVNAVEMTVPSAVDVEIGRSWGESK